MAEQIQFKFLGTNGINELSTDFQDISILQSNKGFCLYVCMYVCVSLHNSGTAEPIWLNFFLLAPSWSRSGFRSKEIWNLDLGFPDIRKKTNFRVLFDPFG